MIKKVIIATALIVLAVSIGALFRQPPPACSSGPVVSLFMPCTGPK